MSEQELFKQIKLAKFWSIVEFLGNNYDLLDCNSLKDLLIEFTEKLYELSEFLNAVIHCRTEGKAIQILKSLNARMKACLLELHPNRTRIVYCKDKDRKMEYELTKFNFLGYTFKGVFIKCRNGSMGINFIVSASKTLNKAFREKIKSLRLHKKTGCKIDMITEVINPIIRDWINYFGKFNAQAFKYTLVCIDRRLVKWAMCKFKRFRGRRKRAERWLSKIQKRDPNLFAHW